MATPGLTRREREVAALVAEGMTNREIAAKLFISERTAESHVEQIRNKLGFHSRAQIAAWMSRQAGDASLAPAHSVTPAAVPATSRRIRPGFPLVVGAAALIVILLGLGIVVAIGTGAPSSAAATISTAAGTGQHVFSADGQAATKTALVHPVALAVGPGGSLYIADGNRVRRIRSDGTMSAFAGNGRSGDAGDGGPATSAELNMPQGLAVDSLGNVFIADTLNNKVRRVGTDGVITTVVGTGQEGYSGDNDLATRATLNLPTGLAIGFQDSLFVADTGNNAVRLLGLDGRITTVAGTGEAGYRGEGVAKYALLNGPAGVAFDGEGNLYVADTLNERLRRVTVDGSIETVAGIGVAGFGGDGGPADIALLNLAANPFQGIGQSVAVDSRGNVYIADALNHRVRRIDVHGTISTIAGGSPNAALGDGGPAVDARLVTPLAVAVDAEGLIYVADADDGRVRRIG